MACKSCGFCCSVTIHKISADQLELSRWRENFIKDFELDGIHYIVMDSKCKYLKDNKCEIYDKRPKYCKEFPDEDSKRLWAKVNPDCGLL